MVGDAPTITMSGASTIGLNATCSEASPLVDASITQELRAVVVMLTKECQRPQRPVGALGLPARTV